MMLISRNWGPFKMLLVESSHWKSWLRSLPLFLSILGIPSNCYTGLQRQFLPMWSQTTQSPQPCYISSFPRPISEMDAPVPAL
ncbi:hypothetical protein BDV59DRAFT_186928 [Aspergillus ambiguus]|uniref:uncharacterized protein n=1 Tax=Aspergillus ambiguus TaxID=176160 RepID=UPI003CCDAF63